MPPLCVQPAWEVNATAGFGEKELLHAEQIEYLSDLLQSGHIRRELLEVTFSCFVRLIAFRTLSDLASWAAGHVCVI